MSGPRSRAAILALGDLLAAEHGESCDCETCLAIQPLVDDAARAAAPPVEPPCAVCGDPKAKHDTDSTIAPHDYVPPSPDPVAGLREADEFHKWLCKTARFSPTGAWGNEVRSRLAALLDEPVPPALAPLFHEALAATIDHLRARAYVVNHHLVVNFEDVYDALAARLTDPKGATDGE